MRELIIACEDGDIVIPVNDDGITTKCASFGILDRDLTEIAYNMEPSSEQELSQYDSQEWDNKAWGSFVKECLDNE
jgi:hypothetical protein